MKHTLKQFIQMYINANLELSDEDQALITLLESYEPEIAEHFDASLARNNTWMNQEGMTEGQIFGGFFHKGFRQIDVVDNGSGKTDMEIWHLIGNNKCQFWDIVDLYFDQEVIA